MYVEKPRAFMYTVWKKACVSVVWLKLFTQVHWSHPQSQR